MAQGMSCKAPAVFGRRLFPWRSEDTDKSISARAAMLSGQRLVVDSVAPSAVPELLQTSS
jgi:hypothetical protein